MAALHYFHVSNNYIGGTLPPELGDNSRVRYLYLHDNQFSGTVPPEITNLTGLTALYLYGNHCLRADAATETFVESYQGSWDNGCG